MSLLRLTWEGSCIAVFVLCIMEGMRDGTQKTEENIRSEGEKERVWGGKNREEKEKTGENRQGRKGKGERIRMNELIRNYLAQKK